MQNLLYTARKEWNKEEIELYSVFCYSNFDSFNENTFNFYSVFVFFFSLHNFIILNIERFTIFLAFSVSASIVCYRFLIIFNITYNKFCIKIKKRRKFLFLFSILLKTNNGREIFFFCVIFIYNFNFGMDHCLVLEKFIYFWYLLVSFFFWLINNVL